MDPADLALAGFCCFGGSAHLLGSGSVLSDMTSLVVASLMVVLGQDSDPKLDLEFAGVSMAALTAHLTKETGQAHATNAEMAGQVVTVYTKGMALSEVKAKIAEATYGKWVEQTGGQTLVSDGDRMRREGNERNQKVAAGIREAKLAVRAMLSGNFKFPEGTGVEGANYLTESWSTPESKMWMLAALQIPDQVLVGVEDEQRVVFSTNPTRMQRGMSSAGMDSLVGEWVKTHNQSINDQLKAIDQGSDGEGGEYMKIMQEILGDSWKPKPVEGVPSKVIAVVTAGEDWQDEGADYPNVGVRLLDESGKVILARESSIRAFLDEASEMVAPVETPDETEPETEQPTVKMLNLPKFVWEYREALQSRQPTAEERPRPAEAMAMILNPDKHEPLAIMSGEAILALAKDRGISVIAALADEDFQRFQWSVSEKGINALDVEAFFWNEENEVPTGTTWVRELENPEDRDESVIRADLAVILNLVARDLSVPLDTMAAFAARNQKAESNGLVQTLRSAVTPDAADFFGGVNSWDALIFYGLLSGSQRDAIKRSETVPLGSLSQGAKTFLTTRVFGTSATFDNVSKLGRKPLWETFADQMSTGMFMDGSAQGLEPTEIMPNGLPNQGYLQGSILTDKYMVQIGKNGEATGLSMPLGSGEMAFIRQMLKTMPPEDTDGVSAESFNRMAMGERTTIDIVAIVAPETGMKFSLMDQKPPDRSKTYTMTSLPPEFEAEVEASIKAMEASPMMKMMLMMMRMGGGMQGGERIKP